MFKLESQMLPGNGRFERTGIAGTRGKRGYKYCFQLPQSKCRTHQRDDQHHDKDIVNYQDLQTSV